MAARRTAEVKAPELEPVPTGPGADEAPGVEEIDARLQEALDHATLTKDQIAGLIRLHARYRVPPSQYVAKLNKSWTDNQGQKKSMTLDYVGHADATDILLREDPAWNWEPLAFMEDGRPLMDCNQNGVPIGMWIKLTVHGVTRLGYGTTLPKGNEGIKELIGDALRNAGLRFGIATSLWSKSDMAQIQIEEEGDVSGPAIGSGGTPPPQRPTSTAPRPSAPPADQDQPPARASGSVSRPADRQPPADPPAPDAPAPAPPSRPEPRPEPSAEPTQERPLADIADGTDPSVIPVDNPTATDLAVAMSSLTGPPAKAFAAYRRAQNLPSMARDYTMQQAWDAMEFIDGLPQAD